MRTLCACDREKGRAIKYSTTLIRRPANISPPVPTQHYRNLFQAWSKRGTSKDGDNPRGGVGYVNCNVSDAYSL